MNPVLWYFQCVCSSIVCFTSGIGLKWDLRIFVWNPLHCSSLAWHVFFTSWVLRVVRMLDRLIDWTIDGYDGDLDSKQLIAISIKQNSPHPTQLHSNRHVSCIQPVCPSTKNTYPQPLRLLFQTRSREKQHTSLPKTSSPMPSQYRKQWNHTASYRSKSSNRYSTRSFAFTQTVTSIWRKGSSLLLRHSWVTILKSHNHCHQKKEIQFLIPFFGFFFFFFLKKKKKK